MGLTQETLFPSLLLSFLLCFSLLLLPCSLQLLHLAPSQSLGEFLPYCQGSPLKKEQNLCSYCGLRDHLLPSCSLSKRPPFVNKTSTLTLLSLKDTFKSPTVLVTIHGPLRKIKVLALLDTGTDVNFIEEKLAKLLRLPASGSLGVKVGNSTLIDVTPILQSVTIDLEGSPFCVMCNSSPNLSFPLILGFPQLRESLLNFDHPNNKISFTCNEIVKFLSFVPGTLGLTPSKPNLTAISSTIPDTLSSKDKNGLPYCYSDFKDCFS
ncbi:hypothetical protein DSO57_1022988 [Entomophthora muscae]|uniref:Uncharacterized protein n=1 Tax=Entomophthora muscae TaxID=34485 RepID=A0ACC2T341_9FUNG|nr:hypothetical protein DSO57_1022988 [Entomophthora muscae]